MYHTAGSPSFFWRVADGNYDDRPLWPYESWFEHDARWTPTSTQGYGQGENHGCRWYIEGENQLPEGAKAETWPGVTELGNGNRWLVIEGVTPQKMLAQGVGYWSPLLATGDGSPGSRSR